MKVLLVLKRSGIGGVETLALRIVQHLKVNGFDVHVLLCIRGDNEEFLRRVQLSATLHVNFDIWKYAQANSDSFDYIYAFELYGLSVASVLKRALFHDSRLCFGVYHPLEYCWPGPKTYLWKAARDLVGSTPDENIFFMNEGMRQRHARNLQRSFDHSPIIPLGVNTVEFGKVTRRPIRTQIISVGRITNFKTYNFHMVRVVAELRRMGHQITYEIFGDGELMEELAELVRAENAEAFIHLRGAVAYSGLKTVFADAGLFVGCGTALVEAAATGLPCLMSVEASSSPISFGFFTETNGYNLGEVDLNAQYYQLRDKVLELIALNEADYKELEKAHRLRAADFEMNRTMDVFQNALAGAKEFTPPLGIWSFMRVMVDFAWQKALGRMRIKPPLESRYIEKHSK